MNTNKFRLSKSLTRTAILACIIPLVLLCLTSYPIVQAQTHQSVSSKRFHSFQQPKLPYNGAPRIGRRKGGAGRPECPPMLALLTAIVPGVEEVTTATKSNSKSVLASTVSEYPTFWVYLPELPAFARNAEFVLQVVQNDNEDEDILRKPLTLSGKPGVFGISLPQTPEYALQVGKKYHWYLKVYCGNPRSTTDNFYIDAWVERVGMTQRLQNQLKLKPEDYTAYVDSNLWYDALTTLALLRRAKPQNQIVDRDWVDLLKAVGLEDLAQAPILEHYTLAK